MLLATPALFLVAALPDAGGTLAALANDTPRPPASPVIPSQPLADSAFDWSGPTYYTTVAPAGLVADLPPLSAGENAAVLHGPAPALDPSSTGNSIRVNLPTAPVNIGNAVAPEPGRRFENVNITFYDCSVQQFCGKMYGGLRVYEGAAACSFDLPLGTRFRIVGDPTGHAYRCDDRGLLRNTWVDVFFYNQPDGYNWASDIGRLGAIEILASPTP
jgi:hypothetical protein